MIHNEFRGSIYWGRGLSEFKAKTFCMPIDGDCDERFARWLFRAQF